MSALPEVPLTLNTLNVKNLATGSPLGNLLVTDTGFSLTPTGGATITTSASPSWAFHDQRRVTIPSLSGTFPNLGLVQFTSSTVPDFPSVAAPGTAPGDLPTYLDSYGNSPSRPINAGETDIRSTLLDASPTVILISDATIAGTGDLDAFNSAFGAGWFPITSTLSYPSPI
ncbi:hypothetical protein BDZ97DRAFT_1915559 [Flammula alnicola]|nr:hypothetical protein BDZ97DRAFT_1915559 [Flammula alnicola]